MFDTPDLGPLCLAPFVAIFIGVLIYGTFQVTNIPTFWGLWDETNKKWVAKYMSGSGIWHLGQMGGTERLEWVVFCSISGNRWSENRYDQSKSACPFHGRVASLQPPVMRALGQPWPALQITGDSLMPDILTDLSPCAGIDPLVGSTRPVVRYLPVTTP